MPSTFPPTVDDFGADVVDGVDDVMAAHVNDLRNAIIATQTHALDLATDIDTAEADITALEAKIGVNILPDTLTFDASWLAGTTLNDLADDTYGPTLWTVLNQSNAPDVQGNLGSTGDPFYRHLICILDATTQVGIVQFLGSEHTKALRGQTVSLSADLWGANIANLRMAVIAWTSTADAVTSDVVGTWGAGNPTLAAGWAYIGTPADIAISITRARKAVENLTIPTDATNIGVFIWTPAQEVSGDDFRVARVKLEPGATATEFVARDPGEELRLIEEFYETSFPVTTAPADGVTAVNLMSGAFSANAVQVPIWFKTRKRSNPTLTLYRGAQGASAGLWSYFSGGVWNDPDSVSSSVTTINAHIQITDTAAFTIGHAIMVNGHWVANSRL